MDGMLTDVLVLPRGSSATQAQAVGDASVVVEDPTDFAAEVDPTDADEENVGRLDICGVQYDYTDVTLNDDGTGTLTLDTPLTVAVDESDPVLVITGGQVAQEWTAVVDPGEGDNLEIPMSFTIRALLPEGHYDPPVPVTVADDLSTLLDAPGRQPVVPAAALDPTQIPEPEATVPPESSPTPLVTAGPAAAVVRFDPQPRGVSVDLYVSTDNTLVADATTLYAEGVTSPVFVDHLPDGSPVPADVDTYVALEARNTAGSAAPSPWVAGRAGVIDPQYVNLIVDQLTANDVVARALEAVGARIGGGTWDSTQFDLPGTLHADLINAVLELTVTKLIIGDVGSYVQGKLNIAAGAPAPSSAPQVVNAWPRDQIFPAGPGFDYLFDQLDSATWVIAGNQSGVASLGPTQIWTIDKTTLAATSRYTFATKQSAYNGVVVGGKIMLLVTTDSSSGATYTVQTIDPATWTKIAEWPATLNAGPGGIKPGPNLFTISGTDLWGAWVDVNRHLRWQQYDVTTGAVIGSAVDAGAFGGSDYVVQAVWGGTADFGGQRVVVAGDKSNLTGFYVFTPAGVRQAADEWKYATNAIAPMAIAWDGTRFVVEDRSSQGVGITRYSTLKTTTARSYTSTRYNRANGAETNASPLTTFTRLPRAWAKVTVQNPRTTTDPNGPQAARYYLDNHLQGDSSDGAVSYLLDGENLTGAPAPTINGFDVLGITPGLVDSDAADAKGPLTQINGDGGYRLAGTNLDDVPRTAIAPASGFSGTLEYYVHNHEVHVRIDGAATTVSGTAFTVAASGAIPAAYCPSLQERSGGYFAGFPGTVTVGTDGSITALQQSGANRGSISATMPPYVPGA